MIPNSAFSSVSHQEPLSEGQHLKLAIIKFGSVILKQNNKNLIKVDFGIMQSAKSSWSKVDLLKNYPVYHYSSYIMNFNKRIYKCFIRSLINHHLSRSIRSITSFRSVVFSWYLGNRSSGCRQILYGRTFAGYQRSCLACKG